MKISIITVVYNNSDCVEHAIRSVLGQAFDNLEYVVVDGGSTDGTIDIIRKYESQISKWVSESDGGMYYALNKGIGMATGDVIGFLHSDDFFADERVVEDIASAFKQNCVQSVYGDLVYVSKDKHKVIRHWRAGDYTEELLDWGWMPPHTTFFVKRSVYENYGFFNTDFKIAADYELILRFFGEAKVTTHYIPRVLIKMRVGGSSNRSVGNLIKKTREDYKALRINGMDSLEAFRALIYKNISKVPQFFGDNTVFGL